MRFEGRTADVPVQVQSRMTDVSWHARLPGGFAPPTFDGLQLVETSYWSFEGKPCRGQLVVARHVADDVLGVFKQIFRAQFPIAKMRLIHEYGGDDNLSMADNNCSAFNARLVAGTNVPSRHAMGVAIDINPVQNPYVSKGRASPPAGGAYLNRGQQRPGMLRSDGPVVRAFASIGWVWGGHWQSLKDYHHFEWPS